MEMVYVSQIDLGTSQLTFKAEKSTNKAPKVFLENQQGYLPERKFFSIGLFLLGKKLLCYSSTIALLINHFSSSDISCHRKSKRNDNVQNPLYMMMCRF